MTKVYVERIIKPRKIIPNKKKVYVFKLEYYWHCATPSNVWLDAIKEIDLLT